MKKRFIVPALFVVHAETLEAAEEIAGEMQGCANGAELAYRTDSHCFLDEELATKEVAIVEDLPHTYKTAEIINKKTTVKVTFEDGNSLVTTINTDLNGAKKYYLGNIFNIGGGEKDNMVKAIKVEEIV